MDMKMRKRNYLKPVAEPMGLHVKCTILAGTDQRYVQQTEDIEEVEGVELGINNINLWEEE